MPSVRGHACISPYHRILSTASPLLRHRGDATPESMNGEAIRVKIKQGQSFRNRNFHADIKLIELMDQGKKFCPNCNSLVESNSDICSHCFTKISRNLENFLLIKYKIFTLIGVFGALSIYLLNPSLQNANDEILRAGSFFSLVIVLILSLSCIWDLIRFIQIEEPDYKNLTIKDSVKIVRTLPAIIMFFSFFIGLILILTLYVLSNLKVSQAIIIALFIIAFTIFYIAVIYLPYRHLLEKHTDIWSRGFLAFVFILALVQFIKNQI